MERALIIDSVWLDMILSGLKTWEMRTNNTKIRGKIGLIEKGTGLIVGEVELVDSLPPLDMDKYFDYTSKHGITRGDKVPDKWRHPWVLRNAKRYAEPIKYKHPQGAVIWVKL